MTHSFTQSLGGTKTLTNPLWCNLPPWLFFSVSNFVVQAVLASSSSPLPIPILTPIPALPSLPFSETSRPISNKPLPLPQTLAHNNISQTRSEEISTSSAPGPLLLRPATRRSSSRSSNSRSRTGTNAACSAIPPDRNNCPPSTWKPFATACGTCLVAKPRCGRVVLG